ncbi:MAG: hypothetical protein HOC71_11825 [Candidatus Latescibacteria bacterium]|nr:hypothetical protein [Candidatus Latescibacterota bacterium]
MDILKTFSEQEIIKHIAWLENEIDVYKECDLQSQHYEIELNSLKEVLSRLHKNNTEKLY